jgi:hypothetical protein
LIEVVEKGQTVTDLESIDGLLWEFRIGDSGGFLYEFLEL